MDKKPMPWHKADPCHQSTYLKAYLTNVIGKMVNEHEPFQVTTQINPETENIYIGETRDSQKHGKGCYIWKEKRLIYDGAWSHNTRHGVGIIYNFKDQTCLKSIFCFGQRAMDLWGERRYISEVKSLEKTKYLLEFIEKERSVADF